MRRRAREYEWAAVALITLAAAVLRLTHIGRVSPDPFYDAAVRSMGLSWHNFFFGAFEPGGSVSIDKPPVDLWLQVLSVKLLGFSSTTLKLPEAFAGIAAVPLLFATVRRVWGAPAGLAAALALAILPVEVITSRSDTMDGVMMVLMVLALLFLVRASETGRNAWLLAAAATLGASSWRMFCDILFRLSLPGVLSGCVIVFTISMTAFSTPVLLGGSSRKTLPYLIYQQNLLLANWHLGAAIAFVLLAMTLIVVTLITRATRRGAAQAALQ
jgi:ABC-type Fe3+ transport system permease subunit